MCFGSALQDVSSVFAGDWADMLDVLVDTDEEKDTDRPVARDGEVV